MIRVKKFRCIPLTDDRCHTEMELDFTYNGQSFSVVVTNGLDKTGDYEIVIRADGEECLNPECEDLYDVLNSLFKPLPLTTVEIHSRDDKA